MPDYHGVLEAAVIMYRGVEKDIYAQGKSRQHQSQGLKVREVRRRNIREFHRVFILGVQASPPHTTQAMVLTMAQPYASIEYKKKKKKKASHGVGSRGTKTSYPPKKTSPVHTGI